MHKSVISVVVILFLHLHGAAQAVWQNVDSLYGGLPASVHVFKTTSLLDGKPNIAYYVEADLRDKNLVFSADTTLHRRLTPVQFYNKDKKVSPIVVMNATFFSFATHQNLNVVISDGRLKGYNIHTLAGRGKDTLTYRHPLGSAIGITKRGKADVAWLFTDSTKKFAWATQEKPVLVKNGDPGFSRDSAGFYSSSLKKWKMKTAVGGGPVLVQDGAIAIANNEEWKFAGKAINDKHPRTAMGYTRDNKLILLVVEGRHAGVAEGADLTQLAVMLQQIGCQEALNLDGGGSSCLLVNGKETIQVSDKEGQRPVPAVFMIYSK